MTWFFFALLTPILFSAANFVDKFLITKKVPNPMVLTILGTWFAGIFGLVIGLIVGFEISFSWQLLILILAGTLLALYLVPYYKALSLDDTSRVVPLYQFVPIFTILISYLFLKESLTLKMFLGFILITVGGFILGSDKIDFGFLKPRPAFWFMLLSGFLYACAGILFRFVVRDSAFWPSLSYEFIGMGIGGLILFVFFKEKRHFLSQVSDLKPVIGLILAGEALSTPARMSTAFALSLAPAAFVTIVGNSQPLFLLLFGLILSLWFPKIIKEDIGKRVVGKKLVNSFLILAGLALIYF